MNLEIPNFTLAVPRSVRPELGSNGVYLVRSQTRPMEHRVDVTTLQCSCESATVGVARRNAIASGGNAPSFRAMCPHLRRALVADALLIRAAMSRARP